MEYRLLIQNLDQLVQVCANYEAFKSGSQQDKVAIINRRQDDNVGVSILVNDKGTIDFIGHDDELTSKYDLSLIKETINGSGCSLIPGLIDSHTHPVWAGDRSFEFDLKLRGSTYLEIHEKGGGIHYTVDQTRNASEDHLLKLFLKRLDSMISNGTTTIEAKTGYGLDFETESKMMRVINRARGQHEMGVLLTFLGAHAIPKGMTADEGVDHNMEMMEKIRSDPKLSRIKIDFLDVFCEKGIYDVNQSSKILKAGRNLFGCGIAFHGDELNSIGSGEMGAEIQANSISHLEYVNQAGIKAMSGSGTVAILCPTTAHLLRLPSPPTADLISNNVPIAIASDFNPNAHCFNLPLSMNLAAVNFNLTLNQALVGCTINAAHALTKSNELGSLEIGKVGDMVLLNEPDWRHLIYQFGHSKDLIKCVIKQGKVIVK